MIAQCTAIALTYAIEAAGSRRLGGGMVSVFFYGCLFAVVGWLSDVGCGFECTLLVPKVCTILIDTGAFVKFCWHERHLKFFYIRCELITKIVNFVTNKLFT